MDFLAYNMLTWGIQRLVAPLAGRRYLWIASSIMAIAPGCLTALGGWSVLHGNGGGYGGYFLARIMHEGDGFGAVGAGRAPAFRPVGSV